MKINNVPNMIILVKSIRLRDINTKINYSQELIHWCVSQDLLYTTNQEIHISFITCKSLGINICVKQRRRSLRKNIYKKTSKPQETMHEYSLLLFATEIKYK